MNRAARRKAEKDYNYGLQIKIASAKKFVEPLKKFLDQVESDSVMVDQNNNILLDMHDAKVKDRIKNYQEPYHAIINLDIMVEIFYQVCDITLDEGIDLINEICEDFRRKILKRLNLNLPIEKSAVAQARDLVRLMTDTFTYTPVNNVNRVKNEINAMITQHENSNTPFPTKEQLREWIVHYKKAVTICQPPSISKPDKKLHTLKKVSPQIK